MWVLKDGENLPNQAGSRKMRTWLLADSLRARGCDVTWWATTFSHQRKELTCNDDAEFQIADRFRLKLLHCGGYSRNVSLARFRHHRRFSRKLVTAIASEQRPDVIVCSFPIIESAWRLTRWANENNIPIVVDVRDYWPDLYVDRAPSHLKPLIRLAFHREFRIAAETFRRADSLTGISHGILDWACSKANRGRTNSDRVFYTAYPDPKPADGACDEKPAYLQGRNFEVVASFAGVFGGSYNLDAVCDVAQRLQDLGDHRLLFVLAGDGEKAPGIRRRCERLNNVVLPGWLSGNELNGLMAHSDIALIPCDSKPDTMPNKFYESLAQGLPLVSSLVGEAEEWIRREQVGLSYRSLDTGELQRILRFLTDHPMERQKLGLRGRRLYERCFRDSDIYSSYANHVLELASRSQPKVMSWAS
ncbi:MAG: glycosyltransferase family 4 protein [Candidatus Paceibacterota bacterium]